MREDEALVERLAAELTKRGATVWRDRNDIEAGVPWRDAIAHAISEGTYFLACFSHRYENRSETYMNEELCAACAVASQRSRAWMIPVNLDGCTVPVFTDERRLVNDVQHVSMHPNWDDGVMRLVEATIQPTKRRMKEEITQDAVELGELAVQLHRAENDLEHAQKSAIEEEVSRSLTAGQLSGPGSMSFGTVGTPSRAISDLSGYHERIAAAKSRFAEKRAAYDQKVKDFLARYDEEFDPFPKMYAEIEARKREIEHIAERVERESKSFAFGVTVLLGILIFMVTVIAIALSSF
jgi:TIR domain-containing protein